MSNTTRQAGYYWVEVKETEPTDETRKNGTMRAGWRVVKYITNGTQSAWETGGEIVGEDIFSEINETRIPSPDEATLTFAGMWQMPVGSVNISINLPIGVSLERFYEAVRDLGPSRISPEQQAANFIHSLKCQK
jgi:hypothetical protein